MHRKNRAVVEEKCNLKRSVQVSLLLLMAAATLVCAGCNTIPSSSAASPVGSSNAGSGHFPVPVLPSNERCPSCVSIRLSPKNVAVAPGGTVQFVAAITNTSKTAVNWSSSAGSISSSGLLTVPATPSVTAITVSAPSVAQSSVQASTGVTVTNTAFAIVTTSLPAAIESSPYSTS